jgi:uncharacterized membrane protein YkvA (DUF1232 family)
MSEDNHENQGFRKDFSEEGFWEKVVKYAKVAGQEVIEKALWLFYAYLEPGTPLWAKGVIVSALGYFISPIDAIPDVIPVVGYSDDLGVLVAALAAVAFYITDNVKENASNKLRDWFGE